LSGSAGWDALKARWLRPRGTRDRTVIADLWQSSLANEDLVPGRIPTRWR
jgi:hypothetical protein